MTKAYRVYFTEAQPDDGDDYVLDHSIVLYLMGPDGSLVDFFPQSVPKDDVVRRMAEHLRDAAKQSEEQEA